MPYEVSTAVFEGPFDLLLHLITKHQVDIYQVSLSSIVDAYVAEIEHLPAVNLDVATEFLLIAAVLLELKARRLLPGSDDVDDEEELALWEERDLLLARLFECKTFKDAATALQRMMEAAGRSFPRLAGLESRFLELSPDLLAGVAPEQLRDACIAALAPRAVPRVDLDHVAPIQASVTDAVSELMSVLPDAGTITFAQLTEGLGERLEMIVRFLAVLELYKRGWVDLAQQGNFGDLRIWWLGSEDGTGDSAAFFPIDSIEEYQG